MEGVLRCCDSREHARSLSIAHVRQRLLAEGSCFVTRGYVCRILTVANGAHNHRIPDLAHWNQGAETLSRIQNLENGLSINTASIVLQLRWLEMFQLVFRATNEIAHSAIPIEDGY